MNATVQIEAEEYLSLFADAMALRALEGAGVDNWEGYPETDWQWVEDEVAAEKEKLDL